VRAPARLRWQLTLSHLVATAVTLASMIAAVLLIGTTWFASQNAPSRQPAHDARVVARAVGKLVSGGETAGLGSILHGLADGDLRLVVANGPDTDHRPDIFDPSLRDIAYIAVLGPAGEPIASSDPAGPAFAPPERDEWWPLAERALSSGTGDEPVVLRQGPGPAALSAAPIVDDTGRRVAAVVVAKAAVPGAEHGFGLLSTLAFFAAATLAVLVGASVFALASASLVAYLLSRRIVGRLERLGAAAGALAAGDVSARVDPGPDDEVGLLGRRFNAMAGDLQRTLAELKAERDRVAGLLEARRQLVAGVSHELRTPVATVRGYLESTLRRDGTLGADLRADLETTEREVIRLQRLIDDLFTLSRAEVGRLELRATAVDVGGIVRRAVETAAPLVWRQRQVRVLADVGPEVPPAHADPQRVEQILGNLLANAARHTPPGGLVAAVVRAEAEAVVLEVRDTGDGIPADDLPHVFERFYRGRDADATGDGGVGLGLALVKELAEAMGGTVGAASTPGEGSRFSVRLPRAGFAAGAAQ
jgi:signal transduction histidine kinase